MAVAPSKKDRLIEEAQRLAGRGQLDKAAKAYEQALALEPSAITIRQKLAELLVKAGRSADARSEFETIGKYYAGHGFYLKAIAVYKQLQKLFPQDITVTMTLAELNERHGLVGNALAEYKQVFEYYERSSNTGEALKVLARMQDVDPNNVNIKLKLAESYFQAGKTDESYATFVRLASLLQERGDAAALFRLNTRIQQLFPEKTTFMLEVLAEQVAGGNAVGAVTGIQALLRNDPNDKRTWELMIAAYRALNQPERLKAVYHHYLKFFPDDVSPRKGLLECLVAERDVTGGLALLAAVVAGGAFLYLQHKEEQAYVTTYVKAVYALKMGADNRLDFLTRLAADWKAASDTGQTFVPRVDEKTETKGAKNRDAAGKLLQKLQKVPQKYEQAQSRLDAMNTECLALYRLAEKPPASLAQLTATMEKSGRTYKQACQELKASLPPKLSEELASAKTRYKGLADF